MLVQPLTANPRYGPQQSRMGLQEPSKVSVYYIPLFRPAIFPVVLAPFCAVRSSVNNMSRLPGLQFTTSVYPKTTDVTPEGFAT